MTNAVQVGDVKELLGIETTKHDSVLGKVIADAEAVVVRRCGPLTSTEVTRRVWPSGGALVLPVYPVVSVTSITGADTGNVLAIEDDDIDKAAGILTPDGLGSEAYDVVYQAGRDVTAYADLKRAVIEMTRYLWRPTQGPNPAAAQSDLGENMAAKRRAEELMAPYVMAGV